ncbi:uncharacterized protein LOC8289705 [Ricinus communis]|uniref:Uncharacterized protein n=1 Tax=Ricinus communis TaxID=3988 RepID=B9T1U5_RICCO|nr:uncharacterized protein LOC8289705 [Ricinus communis]EEF30183.1 conserved hypothetical protein [Ricinus communis]|eukprot:XP_002532214.1 uncharacterized protein LOC8289705 [Ricinus communis]
MLNKLLKVAPFSRSGRSKLAHPEASQEPEDSPSALKIVHAGGKVETYYMAIPAIRILEKYPSYVLAKPEVFRRPWDSVVRPEKILTPGRKFLLVPLRTVKKLRRRVKKPSKDLFGSSVSQASGSDDISVDCNVSRETRDSFMSAFRRRSGIKKHVTFAGIDAKYKASGSSNSEKGGKSKDGKKKSSSCQSDIGKRRPQNGFLWQPSLNSIDESQGN